MLALIRLPCLLQIRHCHAVATIAPLLDTLTVAAAATAARAIRPLFRHACYDYAAIIAYRHAFFVILLRDCHLLRLILLYFVAAAAIAMLLPCCFRLILRRYTPPP